MSNKHKKDKYSWEEIAKFCIKYRKKYLKCMSKKDLKKFKKFEKQYGFEYHESWDLDQYIALYTLPRLAYLREHLHGYPGIIREYHTKNKTEDEAVAEWDRILTVMIKGFRLYVKRGCSGILTDKDKATWNKAKEYFAKYFEHLLD